MKKRVSRNGRVDEHPLIFPNILRHGNDTQIRVPIDDTHTWVVFVNFEPTLDGSLVDQNYELPVDYHRPFWSRRAGCILSCISPWKTCSTRTTWRGKRRGP